MPHRATRHTPGTHAAHLCVIPGRVSLGCETCNLQPSRGMGSCGVWPRAGCRQLRREPRAVGGSAHARQESQPLGRWHRPPFPGKAPLPECTAAGIRQTSHVPLAACCHQALPGFGSGAGRPPAGGASRGQCPSCSPWWYPGTSVQPGPAASSRPGANQAQACSTGSHRC